MSGEVYKDTTYPLSPQESGGEICLDSPAETAVAAENWDSVRRRLTESCGIQFPDLPIQSARSQGCKPSHVLAAADVHEAHPGRWRAVDVRTRILNLYPDQAVDDLSFWADPVKGYKAKVDVERIEVQELARQKRAREADQQRHETNVAVKAFIESCDGVQGQFLRALAERNGIAAIRNFKDFRSKPDRFIVPKFAAPSIRNSFGDLLKDFGIQLELK